MPTLRIYTVSTTFPQENRTFLNYVRYQLFSLHETGRSVALLYQILLQLYSFDSLRSSANFIVGVARLARPAEAISEMEFVGLLGFVEIGGDSLRRMEMN